MELAFTSEKGGKVRTYQVDTDLTPEQINGVLRSLVWPKGSTCKVRPVVPGRLEVRIELPKKSEWRGLHPYVNRFLSGTTRKARRADERFFAELDSLGGDL